MIRWKSSSDFCSQFLSREKQEKRGPALVLVEFSKYGSGGGESCVVAGHQREL